MKTYRILILTLFLTGLFISIGFSQTPESVTKLAFPKLYDELKIEDNTIYDKTQKNQYRDIFYKLKLADEDIRSHEIGAATEDNLQVFALKDLKKIDREEKLGELKTILKNHRNSISKLMYGKEKWGADSVRCIEKYVPFQDLVKAKNYEDAYIYWRVLYHEFPLSTRTIFTRGDNILKIQLKKAHENEKALWKDSLMLMYDQYIVFYPKKKGSALSQKSLDYYKIYIDVLSKDSLNAESGQKKIAINYDMFKEAIALEKENISAVTLLYAMKLTLFQYGLKNIDDNEIVNNYMLYGDYLTEDRKIEQENKKTEKDEKKLVQIDKKIAQINKINNLIDQMFSSTSASTCQNLVAAFEPKFDENPKDVDLMKKILSILSKKSCTDTVFFETVAIALYQEEPSADAAHNIAKLFLTKQDWDNAAIWLDKCIAQETVDTVKANYYFEAAQVASKQGQLAKARTFCVNASSNKENFGKPYILIATLYARSANSCGSDKFRQSAVYWLAVDKLNYAKSIDPSIASEANSLISSYSGNYPSREEGFMQGFNEGASITISCWINETTTARYLK